MLLERLAHMDAQLKASEVDGDRLRMERETLRDRLSELQNQLRDREAEVSVRPAIAMCLITDEMAQEKMT